MKDGKAKWKKLLRLETLHCMQPTVNRPDSVQSPTIISHWIEAWRRAKKTIYYSKGLRRLETWTIAIACVCSLNETQNSTEKGVWNWNWNWKENESRVESHTHEPFSCMIIMILLSTMRWIEITKIHLISSKGKMKKTSQSCDGLKSTSFFSSGFVYSRGLSHRSASEKNFYVTNEIQSHELWSVRMAINYFHDL